MFQTISFLSKTVKTTKRYISCGRRLLQSSYSGEDKSYILTKIKEGDLPGKSIGEVHVSKIIAYAKRNEVNSLEELLNVNGIGPKILRRVCDKILAERDGLNSAPLPPKKKKEIQLLNPYIEESRRKTLTRIVGIHIGHEGISWALINCVAKTLLNWNFEGSRAETDSIYKFVEVVNRIDKMIPESDLYVFEDCSRNRSDLNISYLTAMFITSLQLLRGTNIDVPVVTLVKPSVKNKMYNSYIGSERVSIQNHVVDILEERSQIDCISIPRELRQNFYSLRSSSERENMAQSLLLVSSFIKVILNNQSVSRVRTASATQA